MFRLKSKVNVGTSSCANSRKLGWTQCKFEGMLFIKLDNISKIRNIFRHIYSISNVLTYKTLCIIYIYFSCFLVFFIETIPQKKATKKHQLLLNLRYRLKIRIPLGLIQSSGSKRNGSDNADFPEDNVTVSKISYSNLKVKYHCIVVYLQGWLHKLKNTCLYTMLRKNLKTRFYWQIQFQRTRNSVRL